MSKPREPAVRGWFSIEADRCRLLGTRCAHCGTVLFPRQDSFCANPQCQSTEFAEIELSECGKVWSYTSVNYQPPEPFPADADVEWHPFVLLAVELAAEGIVVLGQAQPGVSPVDVAVGAPVRLVPGVLYEDTETVYTTWNWELVR